MTSISPNSTQLKIREEIFVEGVLIDIDIYWWKGWTQLSSEDIDKDESEIPDIFQLGRKRMLPHKAFENFQLIESRGRTALNKFSYPFMVSTVRFIPFTVLPTLLAELEDLQRAFYVFLEAFVFDYELNKATFLEEYIQYKEKLEDKYPSVFELRGRFRFDWSLFEMRMPRDVKAGILGAVETEKVQQEWEREQSSVQAKLDQWISTVGKLMQKEILTTCKSMKESLDAGRVLRESTLERARETIKRLRKMNFIGDTYVKDILDDLERSLPQNFDREVPAIMNAFKGALVDTMEQLAISSDTTSTGEFKRRFVL